MQTSNPLHRNLYLAAQEQVKRKPRKTTLSTFARAPQPKGVGSMFRKQQSY